LGDFNLDTARVGDPIYERRVLLDEWTASYGAAGFAMLPTTTTWRSHGQFSDPAAPEAPPSHRVSTLDHVYVSDVSGINPVATVLPDSTTDHRPVMVDIDYVSNRKATVELKRQNFKSINPSQFEAVLSAWDWAAIHGLTDVDKAVKYLNDGVMAALDVMAPLRIIHVRHG
jgi:hypothetical protein